MHSYKANSTCFVLGIFTWCFPNSCPQKAVQHKSGKEQFHCHSQLFQRVKTCKNLPPLNLSKSAPGRNFLISSHQDSFYTGLLFKNKSNSWIHGRQKGRKSRNPQDPGRTRRPAVVSLRHAEDALLVFSSFLSHLAIKGYRMRARQCPLYIYIYIFMYIYIYIYMSTRFPFSAHKKRLALRMHVFHPSQACKWLSLQHLRFQLQPRHSSRRNASSQSTRCRATKEPVSIEMWLLHQLQVQLVGEVGWAQIFLAPFHV